MKQSFRILSLSSLIALALPSTAAGLFGVTSGGTSLVAFDSATPGTLTSTTPIVGFTGSLVGLDFRPATGTLYALSTTSNLYTINTTTGFATLASTLSTAIIGTNFGVDFNPTVDRLRIVSDTGQNLRVNVDTGAVTIDAAENFAAGSGNGAPNVTAVAYTNSFAGSTTTALYAIDTTQNSLYLQNPPNNGTLNLVGSLGLDAVAGTTDLDFAFAGGVNTGYAVYTLPNSTTSGLYTINAATGANTLIGSLPTGTSLRLIAAAPVPEPASLAALGVGALALLRRRKA